MEMEGETDTRVSYPSNPLIAKPMGLQQIPKTIKKCPEPYSRESHLGSFEQ